ncbi:MAG: MotA/TolQ/ExbB proton channel family protein [Pseudomonadota bacterium]
MTQAMSARQSTSSFSAEFETLSGLSQWLVWLAILLFNCVILGLAYHFGIINIGMYFVIVSLAMGLIVKGYLDAKFLDNETKLADDQIRILEQVDDVDSFLRRAPRSLFRRHIENLNTIAQSHSEIRQDNLVEILQARLTARNKVTELFSSILITLGLIGTIVGMIVMMTNLKIVMSKGVTDDFVVQLAGEDGPLTGLGMAFVTTLLGAVFGGVILRVLTSIVDANIMRYTAHLAELTEVYVLPYMRQVAGKRNLGQQDGSYQLS